MIRDPTKGIGFVAKKNLPKNLCIPYGGKYLTQRKWKLLYKHCNDGGFRRISHHTAEVDCLRNDGEVELGALDNHPSQMQQEQVPAGPLPGAYCNQGATRAEVNGKLLQHDEIKMYRSCISVDGRPMPSAVCAINAACPGWERNSRRLWLFRG